MSRTHPDESHYLLFELKKNITWLFTERFNYIIAEMLYYPLPELEISDLAAAVPAFCMRSWVLDAAKILLVCNPKMD